MKLDLLVEGLGYLESPRWHRGELWFSDFDAREVMTADASGALAHKAAVPGIPGGLLPFEEGMLVVSMEDQTVRFLEPNGNHRQWSDLSGVAVGRLNDMTGDGRGNVYVGCFGYDLVRREKPRPGPLLHIDAAGRPRIACPDLMFANGMVVLEDERTLIVAESAGRRITRFRIDDAGGLHDRATVVEFDKRQPDGLCIDAERGIWLASPFTEEFVRITLDGHVTHVIPTPGRWAVGCVLGGPDGSTFFALTADTDLGRFARGESKGRIEVSSAPVPALGFA